jgi:hypothetical protein
MPTVFNDVSKGREILVCCGAGKNPPGRFGALEDLVGAAVFLCSDASHTSPASCSTSTVANGVDLTAAL